MDTVVLGVTIYFFAGVLSLVLLDVLTKRIRGRLVDASYDTRTRLAETGNWMGPKTALVVTVFALWILWPVAIYEAVKDRLKGR